MSVTNAIVGALRVVLGMDSAAFEEGATRSAQTMQRLQRSMQRAGDAMQRVGTRLSIGVTLPLAALARQSIEAAGVQEQAMAQVAAAYDSMGGRVGYTLDDLYRKAGELQANSLFGDEEILQKVTANMLTFGNVTGTVFDDAQQLVLDLSTRMDRDLLSTTLMLGKALNDPVQGMSALKEAGVQFTDEQQNMIRAMIDAGDVAGAQALMIEELKNQYGGAAAAAAATDSGKITQAWNDIGDAIEDVGEVILPIIADLAQKLGDLARWFQDLSPETKEMAVKMLALAAAIGPVLIAAGLLVNSLAALLPVIAVLFSPITLIVGAIAGLTYVIWRNWDAIKEWLGSLVEWGANLVTAIRDGIVSRVQTAVQAVKDLWDAIWAEVQSWFEPMQNAGRDLVESLTLGLSGGTSVTQAETAGEQVREGFRMGFAGPGGSIMGWAFQMGTDAGAAVADGFQTETEIQSPSRVFMRFGRFLTEGLAIGIRTGTPDAVQAMTDTAAQVSGALTGGGLFAGLSASVEAFGGDARTVFEKVGGWVADLATGATNLGAILSSVLDNWAARLRNSALADFGTMAVGQFGAAGGGLLSGLFSGLVGNLMGFKTGGSFTVGGVGGADSQVVAFRATPGELVDVRTPGQSMAGGGVVGVRVFVDDDGKLAAVAEGVAGNVAAQVVQTGLAAYDRALPARVNDISANPRRRGY